MNYAPAKVFVLTGIGFYCHACMTHRYDLLGRVVWLLIFFSAINVVAACGWHQVAASFARQWLDPTNRHAQGLFVVELEFWGRCLVIDWILSYPHPLSLGHLDGKADRSSPQVTAIFPPAPS